MAVSSVDYIGKKTTFWFSHSAKYHVFVLLNIIYLVMDLIFLLQTNFSSTCHVCLYFNQRVPTFHRLRVPTFHRRFHTLLRICDTEQELPSVTVLICGEFMLLFTDAQLLLWLNSYNNELLILVDTILPFRYSGKPNMGELIVSDIMIHHDMSKKGFRCNALYSNVCLPSKANGCLLSSSKGLTSYGVKSDVLKCWIHFLNL